MRELLQGLRIRHGLIGNRSNRPDGIAAMHGIGAWIPVSAPAVTSHSPDGVVTGARGGEASVRQHAQHCDRIPVSLRGRPRCRRSRATAGRRGPRSPRRGVRPAICTAPRLFRVSLQAGGLGTAGHVPTGKIRKQTTCSLSFRFIGGSTGLLPHSTSARNLRMWSIAHRGSDVSRSTDGADLLGLTRHSTSTDFDPSALEPSIRL